jgi:D-alanyl-lipoteichoic acid acyltransferase DltB (MBOAT superfamily)
LLPQLSRPRVFESRQAVEGMRQILWGFFKKLVIADGCAQYADMVFGHPGDYYGATVLLGAVFFAFQIYGDFSGYSDIAIGTARLLGIELTQNFAFPYFSRDVAEFWRRWHITLTRWFRDYVYIPLGGSRGGTLKTVRNTIIVFLLCGLWHGANWTFLLWAALNALFFLPLLLAGTNRRHIETSTFESSTPTWRSLPSILVTFLLITLAWIPFRAASLNDTWTLYHHLFAGFLNPAPQGLQLTVDWSFIAVLVLFVAAEWSARTRPFTLSNPTLTRPWRWTIYYAVILLIFLYGTSPRSFIYFQF